ncbi:MAG: hypothetical protein Rhirs2KO_10880 [Rhizobiaceae bacterium]
MQKERQSTDPRLGQLSRPHMLPLMSLIAQWRSQGLAVPNPDPNDGGVNAKVLVLLESPGPKAIRSGFISCDNPDKSAENIGTLMASADIDRRDTVLWNVVPYCVSTVTKNKNASAAQIRAAAGHTQAFIELLPHLKAIVFCGRRAQVARPLLRMPCEVSETFHPGAMAYNRQHLREHMQRVFVQIGQTLRTHA